MSSVIEGLSVLKGFDFEKPPVGVKFSLPRPKDLRKLDKKINVCEMPTEAQDNGAFYVTKEEIGCIGPYYLGMEDYNPKVSGLLGPKLGVYEEPRPNARLYDYIPMMRRNSIRYISFAPLEELSFDPDLLFIHCAPSQAEILLRATGYRTGKGWNATIYPVIACSYLFVETFLTGKVNFTVSPVGYGIGVVPEGQVVVSFPFDVIPELITNLNNMKWMPDMHQVDRDTVHVEVEKMDKEIKQELES